MRRHALYIPDLNTFNSNMNKNLLHFVGSFIKVAMKERQHFNEKKRKALVGKINHFNKELVRNRDIVVLYNWIAESLSSTN